MINRDKLEHILEYAKQQRHIGQCCKVPPEDMVEIMERLLQAVTLINEGNIQRWIPLSERIPKRGDYHVTDGHEFDVQLFDGELFIPGFVWEDNVTHWMPLPAVPEVVKP